MSYRTRPGYAPAVPMSRLMIAGLVAFIALSLVVLLAGRVPFTPQPQPLAGNNYLSYVGEARTLLTGYGYTIEGNIHIPIDRAMDLVAERGLPVRDGATATP